MKATLTAAMIWVSGFSLFAQGFDYSELLSGINFVPPATLHSWSSVSLTLGSGVVSPVGSPSVPADNGADTSIMLIGWSPMTDDFNWADTWQQGFTGQLDLGGPPDMIGFDPFDTGLTSGLLQLIDFGSIDGLQSATSSGVSPGFEIQTVPEPSAFALGGAGLAILWANRKRK
jgi:hypothetical protein